MGGVNQSLRHRAFSAGFRLLAAGRAERWLAPLARGAGVILMFHHVRPWRPRAFAPNRLLEITPAYLDHALGLVRAMGFDLIALDEASDRLRMIRIPGEGLGLDSWAAVKRVGWCAMSRGDRPW